MEKWSWKNEACGFINFEVIIEKLKYVDSATINNNDQKLFISVQTGNNKARYKMFLFISTNISASNFQ